MIRALRALLIRALRALHALRALRALHFRCSCYWAGIKLVLRILLAASPLRRFGLVNQSAWFGRTARIDSPPPPIGGGIAYAPLYSEGRVLYRWLLPPVERDGRDDGSEARHLVRRSDKKMALVAPATFAVAEPDRCARELQAWFLDQGLEARIHLIEDEEGRAGAATLFNAAIAELKDSCDYFVFQPLPLIPERADYRWAEALLSLAEYCRTAEGDCHQITDCPAVLLAPKELLLAVDGFGVAPLWRALLNLFDRANALGYDSAQDIDGFFHWHEAAAAAADEFTRASPEPAEELQGGLSTLKVLEHRQEAHENYQHHRVRFAGPR